MSEGLTMNELSEKNALLVSEVYALQQKLDALAAENAALKEFGEKLNDMHNILNGEGTGIQGRAEVACQQATLEAAMGEFDTIKTPATDAYLNSVRAEGVEMLAFAHQKIVDSLDGDSLFDDFEREHKNICSAAITFADKLRSGTHDTTDKAG